MVDRRLTLLAGSVLIWGGAILVKLVSLQVVHHRKYLGQAAARQEVTLEIPAPRGSIFDRSGRTLAMSVTSLSVYVNPRKLPDLKVASDVLGLVLSLDRDELKARLAEAKEQKRGFIYIKKKISADEADSLRKLGFDWISIAHESQRHYPNNAVAAHLMGGVNSEEHGIAGIEMALDNELRGVAGSERLLTDAKRNGIASRLSTPARPGTSLTLTIDSQVQFVAEQELGEAVRSHHAVSGSLVMMDPNNGDIL